MIYPPTGTPGPEADQQRRRDPDRQLALMLVILAVATALLFYAADLGPSSFARYLGIDRLLSERLGLGTGVVTDTLPVDVTEPAPTTAPDGGAGLFADETPAWTATFPTAAVDTQVPTRQFPTATTSPVAGEGWPTLAQPTSGARATATTGSGYPGLAPGATSGYPSPGSSGPTTGAPGRSTTTPGPGDS